MHIIDLVPPLVVGDVTMVRYIDGHTYEDALGRTYYSGAADPGQSDAEDCLATPRAFSRILTSSEAEALLDSILDGWARERGYASAERCITYVGDPDPTFNLEGVAMRSARSALWVAVRAISGQSPGSPYTEAAVRAFAAPYAPVWPA